MSKEDDKESRRDSNPFPTYSCLLSASQLGAGEWFTQNRKGLGAKEESLNLNQEKAYLICFKVGKGQRAPKFHTGQGLEGNKLLQGVSAKAEAEAEAKEGAEKPICIATASGL